MRLTGLPFRHLLRRRLALGALWFTLAVGHCALRPAIAHAEEPPSTAFYHEFFGRRGYSDPQVEQNLKLGMMNGLSFSPPVEDGVVHVTSPYGAGLMLRLAGAAGPAEMSDAAIEQQRAEFNRLAAAGPDADYLWNLLPEWDQSGGSWVLGGRPHYTGLSRVDARHRFLSYYKSRYPALMNHLRTPAGERFYRLVSVTDYSPNVYLTYELGVELQLLERAIDELGDLSTGLAFIRGAARQYGRDWGIDFSSWRTSNRGATAYNEDDVLLGGWSESYLRRHYYAAFGAGARTILNEATSYRHANGRLNPFGRVTREFADFALKRHPDMGVPAVFTAVLIDHYSGFDPKHGLHNQNEAVWYQDIPYSDGDHMLDNFFSLAFPGHTLHGLAPGAPFSNRQGIPDEGRFRAFLSSGGDVRPYEPMPSTRWGDSLDVITNAAPAEALNYYKVIVLMGEVTLDSRLRNDLREWVRRGGILVMNSAQVTTADEELLGVTVVGPAARSASTSRWLPASSAGNEFGYTYREVRPTTADVLAINEHADPVVTRRRLGAGEVFLTTPDYLQNTTRNRILQVGTQLLDSLIARFAIARVTGAPIEYSVSEAAGKTIVTLINNTSSEWAGGVTIRRPNEFARVMEYINDQPVAFQAVRRDISLQVSVPAFDVRVFAFEYGSSLAVDANRTEFKSSGTEP
jgi:hypothetical protein